MALLLRRESLHGDAVWKLLSCPMQLVKLLLQHMGLYACMLKRMPCMQAKASSLESMTTHGRCFHGQHMSVQLLGTVYGVPSAFGRTLLCMGCADILSCMQADGLVQGD